MKVILCMTTTANGYIATEDGETSWVSQAAEESFFNLAKQAKNVVIGRNAYDAMVTAKNFPVPGVLNVVMTREAPPVEPLANVVFASESSEEVVQLMKDRGFAEMLIAGGGQLAGSFMTDGLVDEIYLNIEPLMLAQGIQLFESADFKRPLELLGTEKISENEVQLHYAVRRTVDSIIEDSSMED